MSKTKKSGLTTVRDVVAAKRRAAKRRAAKRSRIEKVAELANAGMFERPPGIKSGVAMQAEAKTTSAANECTATPQETSHEVSQWELQARAERRLLGAIADCAFDAVRLTAQTAALLAVRG